MIHNAAELHIHELMEPKGVYEHRCPHAPVASDSYHAKKADPRIIWDTDHLYQDSPGGWLLRRSPASRVPIRFCLWCGLELPTPDIWQCTCHVADVFEFCGYSRIEIEILLPTHTGGDLPVKVQVRITNYIHDVTCPRKGLETRGRL